MSYLYLKMSTSIYIVYSPSDAVGVVNRQVDSVERAKTRTAKPALLLQTLAGAGTARLTTVGEVCDSRSTNG